MNHEDEEFSSQSEDDTEEETEDDTDEAEDDTDDETWSPKTIGTTSKKRATSSSSPSTKKTIVNRGEPVRHCILGLANPKTCEMIHKKEFELRRRSLRSKSMIAMKQEQGLAPEEFAARNDLDQALHMIKSLHDGAATTLKQISLLWLIKYLRRVELDDWVRASSSSGMRCGCGRATKDRRVDRSMDSFHNQDNIVLGNQKDELVWRCKKGKESQFSVKQAYEDLRNQKEEVTWSRLVWFSQNIPKHAFVLWMAIQNKLTTQDKIKSWGSFDMMMCPLCQQDMDSHQHLFFQCAYAEQFWKFAMSRMGVQIGQMDWKMIISHMSSLYCGNSIDSVIRRVGFAACVYLIWQERNCRIFRDEKRSIKELTDVFTEIIRMSITFSEFYVINGCLGPWIRCSWLAEDFMKSCQR
ncbi:reverse transcriptase zinc-binding domain-containing protein [Tanacetum coccineum]